VAFVTHGGPDIGLGHVRRCLALAAAWSAERARLMFALPVHDRHSAEFVRRAGFEVVATPWETTGEAIASELRARGVTIAVVDSYAVSTELLIVLGEVVEQVVAVDDVADRPLPVDVVVNGGVRAESLPYDRSGESLLLLGPRFALIDPRFAGAHERKPSKRLERVLIALGGGRHDATVTVAVNAVRSALANAEVCVMVGPFTALDHATRPGDDPITINRDPADPRALMLWADVAIAGAGVTLYELAATGTPAVIIQMADNQAPNAIGFSAAGAALLAGDATSAGLGAAIQAALRRLADGASERATLSERARALVDGAGAMRVTREVGARIAAA